MVVVFVLMFTMITNKFLFVFGKSVCCAFLIMTVLVKAVFVQAVFVQAAFVQLHLPI